MRSGSIAGLIRAWTLPMTVSLILLAASYAIFLGFRVNFFAMVLALFGSLLLHAGANVLNDVNDVSKGVDVPNSPTAVYREHPLLKGEIDKRSAALLSYSLAASGLITGTLVSMMTGPAVFLLELAGAISLFSYNGPLLNLKAKGLGEFLVATVWGPLFVLGGFSASAMGAVSVYAFLISIPPAMIMMATIYSNNYRDIETDVKAGIRSFAYRTSRHAAFIYYIMIIGAYALQLIYVIVRLLPAFSLLSFVTLPYSFVLLRYFRKRAPDIDARTGVLFTAYNLLIALALFLNFLLK